MARARVRVPQLRPLIGSGAAVLAAVLVGLTAAPTVSAATNGQDRHSILSADPVPADLRRQPEQRVGLHVNRASQGAQPGL